MIFPVLAVVGLMKFAWMAVTGIFAVAVVIVVELLAVVVAAAAVVVVVAVKAEVEGLSNATGEEVG